MVNINSTIHNSELLWKWYITNHHWLNSIKLKSQEGPSLWKVPIHHFIIRYFFSISRSSVNCFVVDAWKLNIFLADVGKLWYKYYLHYDMTDKNNDQHLIMLSQPTRKHVVLMDNDFVDPYVIPDPSSLSVLW